MKKELQQLIEEMQHRKEKIISKKTKLSGSKLDCFYSKQKGKLQIISLAIEKLTLVLDSDNKK